MTQDTKAPERIWAWCWNYVGPFDGKPAWSSFKPSFDHLFKTEVVETSWNPLNKRFWIQKRKVPDQMVFEYARLDLLTAAEARAEAAEQSLAYERALTDGAHRRARNAEAERDRLAALVKGLINEAVGMADDRDEAAYVERRLRAILDKMEKTDDRD